MKPRASVPALRPLLPPALPLIALCACAPTQSAGTSDPLLFNGQTWHVTATTAAGTTESYTIALDASGGPRSDGTTVYRDTANRTALFLYPAKGNIREYFAAVNYNTPSRGDPPPICAIIEPSKSANPRSFQGRFSAEFSREFDYIFKGKTDGLGTCTMTR